ncbi:MAG: hypothetical protein U0230_21155 [Polyangiales bacterium]
MHRFPRLRSWGERFGAVPLAAALLLLGSGRAHGGGPNDDGAPVGAVAFFASGTACPNGWAPATAVEGRMIVGVTDGAAVGVNVGTPLADQENRTHTHAYTGTFTITKKGIAALAGSNTQGANAQAYSVSGTTAASTSGLPFVQVLACVKQ